MTINIPELRRIINELLLHAERVAGAEITIVSDNYWDLPSPALWDVSQELAAINTIGSLADDLEFLRGMKEITKDGPSLNLIHAAPLLRYIGERVGA